MTSWIDEDDEEGSNLDYKEFKLLVRRCTDLNRAYMNLKTDPSTVADILEELSQIEELLPLRVTEAIEIIIQDEASSARVENADEPEPMRAKEVAWIVDDDDEVV